MGSLNRPMGLFRVKPWTPASSQKKKKKKRIFILMIWIMKCGFLVKSRLHIESVSRSSKDLLGRILFIR